MEETGGNVDTELYFPYVGRTEGAGGDSVPARATGGRGMKGSIVKIQQQRVCKASALKK